MSAAVRVSVAQTRMQSLQLRVFSAEIETAEDRTLCERREHWCSRAIELDDRFVKARAGKPDPHSGHARQGAHQLLRAGMTGRRDSLESLPDREASDRSWQR